MRNLSLWKTVHTPLSLPHDLGSHSISSVVADPDQDFLYVALEIRNDGSGCLVEIWSIDPTEDAGRSVTRMTTHTVPVSVASNPWFTGDDGSATSEVICMRMLPDTRTIVLVTRTGDLMTLQLDDPEPKFEIVGSIEAGVSAASWSPDETLLVVTTADDKLILMTSTFDVLVEGPLHPSSFGEDAPIALGWGEKRTQFHGSLGKAAAQAGLDLSTVGISPDDDGTPRISWRGDGAFFVVSAVAPTSGENTHSRRVLRVYSREGALSSTAEPLAGLEQGLAWRPSGNLIASTQRFGSEVGLAKGKSGRHDVVFFERNGLRHGEFWLRERDGGKRKPTEGAMPRKWGYKIKELGWSSGSNVLSVWIEGDDGDIVQLWTTGNHHWYLKQEIEAPPSASGAPGRFTTVTWHPEFELRIILATSSQIIERTYMWETCTSRAKPPNDTGSAAVFDGANVLLTSFRSQNVPPPMASCTLSLPAPVSSNPTKVTRSAAPVHGAFSCHHNVLALLWESGHIEVYDLHTRIGPGRGKAMEPSRVWQGMVSDDREVNQARSHRQLIVLNAGSASDTVDKRLYLATLATGMAGTAPDIVCVLCLGWEGETDQFEVEMLLRNGRLMSADGTIVWQAPGGDIFNIDLETRSAVSKRHFPEFCITAWHVSAPALEDVSDSTEKKSPPLYIGLSYRGKLYAVDEEGRTSTISTDAISFTVASGFLIFTDSAHIAHFAPLSGLPTNDPAPPLGMHALTPTWETRRVERGSRIVTAIPSTMSLVLQMPRGNLETINPRPLVMAVVRKDIDRGEYGKAFLACRKHRVDLNVLVEHNPSVFKDSVSRFVQQVDDVDYINLFLTSLGQGILSADVVSDLCDCIRVELEKRDMKRYVSSILTGHVVKRPPDHETALGLLLRLRDNEPQLVEDAVKYIIFLVDADKLFDTALGMYDFSLALMIAQHSQKDPREYLPFLRELRALEHHYQRFRIDDHLKRHEKALQNLSRADRFDEAMSYVEKHRLYDAALSIWRATDQYKAVLNIYGDWLFERRDFRSAAFVFREASRQKKAMVAHEKALDWQELFELALLEQISKDDLSSTAYRIAEDLSSKKRYLDAARVLLDYADDVKETIKALVEGNHYSEARRVIASKTCPDLLADIVHPAALESRAQIAEDIKEVRDQIHKQVHRLRELRVRKVEEPDAFGMEDADLHNVDVMTDVSMAPTAFTRYTQAPTSVSRTSSKRSSRSKRKLERKVGSGRKGTVDEEEYLLKSVSKLVGRFNATQADAACLLPHLFQFTEEHQTEARKLQKELQDCEAELNAAIDEIWTKSSDETEADTEHIADGWAARMQEYEKQRRVNPLEKVDKPELAKQEWKLRLPEA